MKDLKSPILTVYINEGIEAVRKKRFEFALSDIYFHCSQQSFYLNMLNHNTNTPTLETNLLDLFCIRFSTELYISNFHSDSWNNLLNQIHSPYLTDRIISEYNRSHSYHKSTTRFMSDDDDIVKYYYPVYKALLVDFNCRAWFSSLDIDKLIQNLQEAFSESSIRVNTITKTPPYPEKQTLEVKQLCDTFVSDRDDLYKLKPVSENNVPGYCKQMIILHYKFIMNYEKLVAEIIG